MAKKKTDNKKTDKKVKKTDAVAVQSDSDAEDTLSELEGMVSPRSESKKSGFDKVNDRAQEMMDGDHKAPTVFGPGGATTHAGNTGNTDVVTPGIDGAKKVDDEAMKKKSKAEEGGIDPSYNPSGKFVPPPQKNVGVALPNAAKARDKMGG